MYIDSQAKEQANHIIHVVQENESIQLSDKSRYDIFASVNAAASYWKEDSDKLRKQNHAKRWNELKLWINRYPQATVKDIETVMEMLDRGLYIRNCKIE
jgi:phage host-nuclease inhibitor protein Gam